MTKGGKRERVTQWREGVEGDRVRQGETDE